MNATEDTVYCTANVPRWWWW